MLLIFATVLVDEFQALICFVTIHSKIIWITQRDGLHLGVSDNSTGRCPVCKTDEATRLFQASDADTGARRFDVLRCSTCGLARTNPILAETELADYYAQDYYGTGERKFAPPLEKLVQWTNQMRGRRLLSRLGPREAGHTRRRILDIGCGRGGLLRTLSALDCDCYGLERADFTPPGDAAGFTYKFGELLAQDFPEESFDLVVIWHVLEHLPDPAATLGQATGLLRPGGVLALAVPNFASRQARWFTVDWFHLDLPRHLWHFTANDLNGLCESLGLNRQHSSGLSLEQNPFGFIQSFMNHLFSGAPNRFYRTLTSGYGRKRTDLTFWGLLALLLLPVALLETLLSTGPAQGATLIQYWEKPCCTVSA